MRQEGNHIAFYASEADRRLSAHRARSGWSGPRWPALEPGGRGRDAQAEVAFMARTLFGGADGRTVIERIDRRIDRLPGLEHLALVTRALERYGPPDPGELRRRPRP